MSEGASDVPGLHRTTDTAPASGLNCQVQVETWYTVKASSSDSVRWRCFFCNSVWMPIGVRFSLCSCHYPQSPAMPDIPAISATTAVLLPSIFHTGHTVARMSVNDLYTTFGLRETSLSDRFLSLSTYMPLISYQNSNSLCLILICLLYDSLKWYSLLSTWYPWYHT